MDTGSLAVIVGHWKQVTAAGGTLALAGARYRYTKTLWVTGLADRLPMYDTVDAAIAAGAAGTGGATAARLSQKQDEARGPRASAQTVVWTVAWPAACQSHDHEGGSRLERAVNSRGHVPQRGVLVYPQVELGHHVPDPLAYAQHRAGPGVADPVVAGGHPA